MSEKFADGWVTSGFSRVDGKWVEMGAVAGVTSSAAMPTELPIHEVADYLNRTEAKLEAAPHAQSCAFELSKGCKYDCPGCIQRRSDFRVGPQIPHVPQKRKPCDCWKAGL